MTTDPSAGFKKNINANPPNRIAFDKHKMWLQNLVLSQTDKDY